MAKIIDDVVFTDLDMDAIHADEIAADAEIAAEREKQLGFDNDKDVTRVEFNDLKLMGAHDPEAEIIDRFISSYPYLPLTYICRRLKMRPAECLERVLAFNEEGNGWYSQSQEAEGLTADAARLIEEGWEPGMPPSSPMTKGEVFALLNSIFTVELNLKSTWTIYDMAYRSGLDATEMAKWIVDYTVSHVLCHFKYMGNEKWRLSPDEIKQSAANCRWITGEPTLESKRPEVPYVDYCSGCGQSYAGTESACAGCGALRTYTPPPPPPKGMLEDIDELGAGR